MGKLLKHYASLHSHSTHSDGVYTPAELVRVAKEEGYHAIALTDHDTVTGNAEVKAECEKLGLQSIFGVEFSTHTPVLNRDFHMTAYHFDPEYPEMKEYLWQMSEREADQTRQLFERGVEIGYIKGITWNEVLEYNEGISWLCNDHVFRAMKAKGLISDLDYPEFFDTCFGKYRSIIPPKYNFMDAEKLIPLVHKAGGIILIAHPHTQLDCIEYLVGLGIDGMEIWSSNLDGAERREALRLADKFDLYVGGGSDHEGILGGEYIHYEHPEETPIWFPPCSLGTTKYFFEEIRDMKKKPDRHEVMKEMIDNSSIWERIR